MFLLKESITSNTPSRQVFEVDNADANLTLLEILVTSMNQYEAPNCSKKRRFTDSSEEKREPDDDEEGNCDVI